MSSPSATMLAPLSATAIAMDEGGKHTSKCVMVLVHGLASDGMMIWGFHVGTPAGSPRMSTSLS